MSLRTDQGPLSETVHDGPLHGELQLLAELIVVASESAAPLTPDQIDRVLLAPHIVRQRGAD